jgi:CheY-like chemotaxis protein
MTILVIEDSRFLRTAMERILVKAGYQVIGVGDGQEGLRLAQETNPQIILLDMMLPTLEGTSVLRRLKAESATKSIPVVILSGLSQKNEQKLKMAGAAAYFEKSKLSLEDDGKALVQAVRQASAQKDDALAAVSH